MMTPLLLLILRIILVVLVITGMIVAILGINQLLVKGHDEKKEMERLRRDIRNGDKVITKESSFNMFLVRPHRRHS